MKALVLVFIFFTSVVSIHGKSMSCANFRAPKCKSGQVIIYSGDCRVPYCADKRNSSKMYCPVYNRTNTPCAVNRWRHKYRRIKSGKLTCKHDSCVPIKYVNSVDDDNNCADPALLYSSKDKLYYRSCTKFQLYTSKNMKDWKKLDHKIVEGRYPTNHGIQWSDHGKDWAPELAYINGKYVAYLTLNDPRKGRDTGIIGVASGKSMDKPLELMPRSLVRNDRFGIIDPSYFKDPKTSKHYLLYKLDTNKHYQQKQKSRIIIRELDSSGMSFKKGSRPKTIALGGFTHDSKYEGQDMIEHNGYYYLFYSTGKWRENYKVYVSRSKSPLGPFDDSKRRLFLSSPKSVKEGQFFSPGHGKMIKTSDGFYYLYHALKKKNNPVSLSDKYRRYSMIDKVDFKDGYPVINPGYHEGHPSTGWKPLPRP